MLLSSIKRSIEVIKLVIRIKYYIDLTVVLLSPTQQHPKVLYSWAIKTVIKIDKVRNLITPKNIAHVAVSVNPYLIGFNQIRMMFLEGFRVLRSGLVPGEAVTFQDEPRWSCLISQLRILVCG